MDTGCHIIKRRQYRRGSQYDVGWTIQRGFRGVLKNTDDKAYADNLESNIVADAEKAASQRNKHQGTACNAWRPASAQRSDNAQ